MSDAIIVRRGSTGGLSPNLAVLHINALVGSTITLAKGGVTVNVLEASKGHISAKDIRLAEWYYSISPSNYGAWTVTASKDGTSVSRSVTVNSNMQYDLFISEQTIIDVNTMTLEELLASTIRCCSSTYLPYRPTKKIGVNQIYYFCYESAQASSSMGWQLTRQIDVTNYDYLVFSGYRYNSQTTYANFGFGDTLFADDAQGVTIAKVNNIATRQVTIDTLGNTVLDISGISGSYYFGIIRTGANSTNHTAMYVEKVYMTNFL